MSRWYSASAMPTSADPEPSAASTGPHHSAGSRNPSVRRRPYSPSLINTPDMSAEMCDGAAAWASGNQTWSGTIPALTPKPSSASTAATAAAPPPSGRAASSANPKLPRR